MKVYIYQCDKSNLWYALGEDGIIYYKKNYFTFKSMKEWMPKLKDIQNHEIEMVTSKPYMHEGIISAQQMYENINGAPFDGCFKGERHE
jgi:hypothetical protein